MPKELARLDLQKLPQLASEMSLSISIDADKLRAEVETHTYAIATLEQTIASLAVEDDNGKKDAVALRNEAHGRGKSLQEIVDRYKKPLNTAHDAVMRLEKATVGEFERLKVAANKKISEYDLEQIRAKKKADQIMADTAARARSKLAIEAEDLMAQGYVQQAEEVSASIGMISTPVLPNPLARVAGNKSTTVYRGRVFDIIALIRSIADSKTPLSYEVNGELRPLLVVDQAVLRALVSRQQDNLRIPGIAVEEDVISGVGR